MVHAMNRNELTQKIADYMSQDEALARDIERATSDRERYDIERLRRIRGVTLTQYLIQFYETLHNDPRPAAGSSVHSEARA